MKKLNLELNKEKLKEILQIIYNESDDQAREITEFINDQKNQLNEREDYVVMSKHINDSYKIRTQITDKKLYASKIINDVIKNDNSQSPDNQTKDKVDFLDEEDRKLIREISNQEQKARKNKQQNTESEE